MHKGIILNVENYPGKITFALSTAQYNYILIPEIFFANYSYYQDYSFDYFYNAVN